MKCPDSQNLSDLVEYEVPEPNEPKHEPQDPFGILKSNQSLLVADRDLQMVLQVL